MNPQVYLDGELVDSSAISPKKHKFIGMFRPAVIPQYCALCGQMGKDTESVHNHYNLGHSDIPQYVTL